MRLLQLFVFGFGLALALSGCLGVDIVDGALICSDDPQRECPQGYYCLASSNHCWRYGHFPEDMAEPAHFNPGPPDDLSVPVGDDLGAPDDLGTVPDDLSQTD